MRHVLYALLGLALLALAASPAWAAEVCEGDGYKVQIPAGFKEAMSMNGTGTMNIKSNIGCLPIDGMPETTIYIHGDMADPKASIIVARVNIKAGHEIDSIDKMGMHELEAMKAQMPEGFEFKVRKVGTYDAVEMKMAMEMLDDEMTMRMVSVAGGDFVMVVMLQTTDEYFPAADSMWETMVSTMELSSGSNKLLLYGGIGLGVLVIIGVLAKFSSSGNRGGYVEVTDWRNAVNQSNDPTGRPGRMEAMRTRPNQLPPNPRPETPQQSEPAPMGQPQPTPAGGRPSVEPPAGRPGLRPTLPPSGNWSDNN